MIIFFCVQHCLYDLVLASVYNSLTKEHDDSFVQQFFILRFVFVETNGNWSGIVVKLTAKNAHPVLKGVYPSICSQHPKVRGKVTRKCSSSLS